ncbi:PA1136 family autoinducer-binding transcriptional regulator [Acetobacter orleanensis]|uniref:LuxR family transcriptional regulator n=1 Tax=Acetobacter orleanensis TaxID=104099 RepID=A0A4Y3TQ87_9PROT|nr:PA1136 family autoinducer-binding transcriptional regulator [Acetobacter orleanensis]KXV66867.1 LuxR family transcriptional regulator [Acetobacter orleanensis]PCD78404.1 LuxR family transcriptional regulator [Acetobacter orleanensis]GAN69330.1 transcriptional regulator LuxR [Acetobacter orleanensis JCM 7639]GBR21996.1 LuxR family transcriptional regulator [Acetobacter orleanensis NRIC 0473]GEB83952.1 LuxR family transcriptional regulator [Acetobacter orleanensis]
MTASIAETAFGTATLIVRSETKEAVEDGIRSFGQRLGYDRFVLFAASSTREEIVDRIYWVEGDWFGDSKEVDAASYVRRCPVTHHMLEAHEPFFWTKTSGASGECYRMVDTPQGEGLHGIQIPIFGPLGLEGAMSLGGIRIDASVMARLALSMVARAAFTTVRKLVDGPSEKIATRLSEREREVLSWTAAGRRQVDIAAILGLSERTVENHLRRIRKRLGATTTAQAIRTAIQNGDIES